MQPAVLRSELFMRRIDAERRSLIGISRQSADFWQAVGSELSPVIGKRGMTAVFERALHLASARHPWLAGLTDADADAPAFAAVAEALPGQTEGEAIAAMVTLFETFDRLLVGLIGEQLTDRLLQPIWALPSAGTTRQDIP